MQSSRKATATERNGVGIPTIVELNVGGQLYTTSLSTLLRDPESVLANMFSGRQRVIRDSRGRFFIDRDGVLFKFVLDFLRNNNLTLPDKFTEYERLLTEAEHYGIKGLVKAVKMYMISGSSKSTKTKRPADGFITLCVRGTYAFGRDGLADIKFRKLQRILVCGNVAMAREAFGDSLNETRDPDREERRYTNRFFLKHNQLERAFDQLHDIGFKMVTSAAGGAGYDPESEETKWNHFCNYVFCRE